MPALLATPKTEPEGETVTETDEATHLDSDNALR